MPGQPASPAAEIVPTLTMPEAVDAALVRMLGQAGTRETSGCDFGKVLLVSNDLGLRTGVLETLRRRLRSRFGYRKAVGRVLGLEVWLFDVAEAPLERFFPAEPEPAGSSGLPPKGGPVVPIESRELASWVANQPLQPTGDLAQIARQVNNRPSFLTQVGLTQTTPRGLERMGRRAASPNGRISLGACAPEDGVEYCVRAAGLRPNSARRHEVLVEPTGLGPGAVRLRCADPPDLVNTLATRLPLWVVKGAAQVGGLSARHRLSWPVLADDRALGAVPSKIAPASERVTVRLYAVRVDRGNRSSRGSEAGPESADERRAARRGLAACIERPGDAPPKAWWVQVRPYAGNGPDVDVSAKLRIEDPPMDGVLPSGEIRGIAAIPATSREGDAVLLRALTPADVHVVVERQVPANTIAAATDEQGRRVAVLALGGSIPARWRGKCACIQDVDASTLARRSHGAFSEAVIRKLQLLPVLVPVGPPEMRHDPARVTP